MSRMINSALALAELGYRVFPCVAGKKIPATMHGCLDATTDERQIETWWTRWPEANIAVATEGLLVVDVDPREDGSPNEWLTDEARMESLQKGAVAVTPRGGRHCWFRQPDGANWGSRVGALAERVDTRGNGGYVLVPPSVTEAGEYRWLPAWELSVEADRLPAPPEWLANLMRAIEGRKRISIVQDAGEAVESGARNDTLARMGGYVRRMGAGESEIREFLLACNLRRCRPPLDEKEVCKIAWSIARYDPDQATQATIEGWAETDARDAAEHFEETVSDPGPLPEGLCDPPGFLGDVTRWNLATAYKPQPHLALAGALALLAALTGRNITDRMGTRTNLYTLGVAPSGAGKEHARKCNKLILQAANLERRIGPEDFGSHAGLICAVSDQPEILFQLDEMGRFLATTSGANAPAHLTNIITVLLKLYTSSNSLFVGPAYADSAKIKKIEQPHACLYGTTVPESLFGGLTTDGLKDGFVGRLLIFEGLDRPERSERPEGTPEGLTDGLDGQPPEAVVEVARWWRDYMPGGLLGTAIPRPRRLTDSPEAGAAFLALCEEVEAVDPGDAVRAALWARAHEKARKMALLYAVSVDPEAAEISRDAAEWGCQIVRHLTRRMEFLASRWVSSGTFEALGKRIRRLIEGAGPQGLTGAELFRRTQDLRPKERSEVIGSLELSGWIIHERSGEGRGRKKNTYIAAQFASRKSSVQNSEL